MAGSEDVDSGPRDDFSDRAAGRRARIRRATVESDGRRSSVLYDAGLTPDGLGRNLDVLGIPVEDLAR